MYSCETTYSCTEMFKTLNYVGPNFMKENCYISPHNPHRKHDIFVQSWKTTKYGNKSPRGLSLHLRNSLPEKIKFTTSIFIFEDFMKT